MRRLLAVVLVTLFACAPVAAQQLTGPTPLPTPAQIGAVQTGGDVSTNQVTQSGGAPRTLLSVNSDAINANSYQLPTDLTADQWINRAIAVATARGGAEVDVYNTGAIFSTAKITLPSNVRLVGIGRPELKLAPNVNDTVVETSNFANLTGTATNGGVSNFALRGFIIDGNAANNTSPKTNGGNGVSIYGRDFVVEDVYIQNTAARGLHTEYAPAGVGTSPFNGRVHLVTTDTTQREGWYNNVSDLHADDINVKWGSQAGTGLYDGIYLGSTGGIRGSNINAWNNINYKNSLNIDGANYTSINGGLFESGGINNVRINASRCNINVGTINPGGMSHVMMAGSGNQLFLRASTEANGIPTTVALSIGESSSVQGSGNYALVSVSGLTGGLIDWTNSAGGNIVDIGGYYTGSTLNANGSTPLTSDRFYNDRLTGGGVGKAFGGRVPGAISIGDGANATVLGAFAIGTNATSTQSGIAIGSNVTNSVLNGRAQGSRALASSVFGEDAYAQGLFSTNGDVEKIGLQWYGAPTSNGSLQEIFNNGVNLRAALPANTQWSGTLEIQGHELAGGSSRYYRIVCDVLINRGASASATSFAYTPVCSVKNAPTGFSTNETADTTNGALDIFVQAPSGASVRWHALFTGSQVQG